MASTSIDSLFLDPPTTPTRRQSWSNNDDKSSFHPVKTFRFHGQQPNQMRQTNKTDTNKTKDWDKPRDSDPYCVDWNNKTVDILCQRKWVRLGIFWQIVDGHRPIVKNQARARERTRFQKYHMLFAAGGKNIDRGKPRPKTRKMNNNNPTKINEFTALLVLMSVLFFKCSRTLSRWPSRAERRKPALASDCGKFNCIRFVLFYVQIRWLHWW